MEASQRSAWRKYARYGCGCLFACALGIGVFAALNWDKVSSFVSETAGVLSELYTLQRVLQEKYPGAQVSVELKSHGDVEGRILKLEVVNAPFFTGFDFTSEEARAKALEIAASARDATTRPDGYARYEIEFKVEAGAVIQIARARTFRFEAGELPASPPR